METQPPYCIANCVVWFPSKPLNVQCAPSHIRRGTSHGRAAYGDGVTLGGRQSRPHWHEPGTHSFVRTVVMIFRSEPVTLQMLVSIL